MQRPREGFAFTATPAINCIGTADESGTLTYSIKKLSGAAHDESDYTLSVAP